VFTVISCLLFPFEVLDIIQLYIGYKVSTFKLFKCSLLEVLEISTLVGLIPLSVGICYGTKFRHFYLIKVRKESRQFIFRCL